MKRAAALVTLVCLIALWGMPSLAENGQGADTLKVGHTTRMNGNFFSDLWGNNTADIDVRSLLHDYPLVAWTRGGEYKINRTVVSKLDRSKADNGDTLYTVTLHSGLQYCDGSPIQSEDFLFSILLMASPQIRQLAPISPDYDYISGFQAYHAGAVPAFSGLRLIDDLRFSVRIKASYLPYFYQLSYINSYPLPIRVLAPGCAVADDGQGAYIKGEMTVESLSASILDGETGYMSFPQVTSGPYRLVRYDMKAHVAEFEKNPYYKGNYEGQVPGIPRLLFREVRNQTILSEMEAGTIDLVNKVSDGEVIDNAIGPGRGGRVKAVPYPRTGAGFLAIACEKSVTSSVLVRQALAHCIDPEVLPRDFLKNHGEKIYGYYGLGQWMVEETKEELKTVLPQYPLDLEKADALLREDGWVYNEQGGDYDRKAGGLRYRKSNDGKLKPFRLTMAVLEENKAAYMVLDMLSSNLGQIGGMVDHFVLPLDQALRQHYSLDIRQFDILFMGSNFTYLFDPTITYQVEEEYQGTANTSGIQDPVLAQKAREVCKVPAGDRKAFLKNWLDFQRYWAEVLPMIPLYSNTYFDLFIPQLTDYHPESHWNWGSAILYAKLKR